MILLMSDPITQQKVDPTAPKYLLAEADKVTIKRSIALKNYAKSTVSSPLFTVMPVPGSKKCVIKGFNVLILVITSPFWLRQA
jgi:hypothetical protein